MVRLCPPASRFARRFPLSLTQKGEGIPRAPFAGTKGEIPRFAPLDSGFRRNDVGRGRSCRWCSGFCCFRFFFWCRRVAVCVFV